MRHRQTVKVSSLSNVIAPQLLSMTAMRHVDHGVCDLDPRPRAFVATLETVTEHQEVAVHCAAVEDSYAADRFSVNE